VIKDAELNWKRDFFWVYMPFFTVSMFLRSKGKGVFGIGVFGANLAGPAFPGWSCGPAWSTFSFCENMAIPGCWVVVC